MFENIIADIKTTKFYKKWIYPYHWMSGSSTIVYPIQIWEGRKELEIQLGLANDCSKRGREKAIQSLMTFINKYYGETIKYWYVSDNHGDCPDTLNIFFK